MKRIISFILIIVVLLSAFPGAYAQSEQMERSTILSYLGIDFSEEGTSRREYAEALAKLFCLKDTTVVTEFSDLQSTDSGVFPVIHAGIMKGIEKDIFAPERNVTLQEAITTLVIGLGFQKYAELNGGYPMGYLNSAREQGILDSMLFSDFSAEASGAQLETMFYNALEVSLNEISFEDGNLVFEQNKNLNLLNRYHDIEIVFGQITGVGFTGLREVLDLKDDQISFEDRIYQNAVPELRNMLGYRIEAYIYTDEDTNEEKIVAYRLKKTTKKIVLEHEYIDSFENFRYNYGEKTSKYYRVGKTADVIYNGIPTSDFLDEDFVPEYGRVILLDSDGDGEYDVVQIFNLKNYVVNRLQEEAIYFKDGTNISENEWENLQILDIAGDRFEVSDLIEWDVLSIGVSKDGAYRFAYLMHEKVGGYVDSVGVEDGITTYHVRGESYKEAPDCYLKNGIRATINSDVDFHLDFKGMVAAQEASNASGYSYAYLIRAYQLDDQDACAVKFLDGFDGKIKRVQLAEKVKIDGKNYQNTEWASILHNLKLAKMMVEKISVATMLPVTEIPSDTDVFEQEAVDQVIRLRYNADGEVREIDTAYVARGENADSLHLSPQARALKTRKVKTSPRSFDDSAICYTPSTLAFQIPTELSEENRFGIYHGNTFGYDQNIYGRMYTTVSDVIADVVLEISQRGSNVSFSGYGNIYVIEKIAEEFDENKNETQVVVTLFGNGKRTELIADAYTLQNGQLIDRNDNFLEKGDAVMYSLNSEGEITAFELVYNYDKNELTSAYRSQDAAMIRFSCVYDKYEDYAGLLEGSEITSQTDVLNSNIIYCMISAYPIIVYDSEMRNGGSARVGNVDDLLDYKTTPFAYSKLILHSWQGNPRGIIIYK